MTTQPFWAVMLSIEISNTKKVASNILWLIKSETNKNNRENSHEPNKKSHEPNQWQQTHRITQDFSRYA